MILNSKLQQDEVTIIIQDWVWNNWQQLPSHKQVSNLVEQITEVFSNE